MTDLQNLVRQTCNPSILKMQQRLHEEVVILGKIASELKSDNEHFRLQRSQVDRDNLTLSQEWDEEKAALQEQVRVLSIASKPAPGWKMVPICLTPDMRVELLNANGLPTAELYTMLLAAAPNCQP